MHISEADWKRLRRLKEVALERLCTRILEESQRIIEREQPSHERFLALYRHLQDRNHDMAVAFDDLRRSQAVHRLASMCSLGLVTDEELQAFSPETRQRIELLLGLQDGSEGRSIRLL